MDTSLQCWQSLFIIWFHSLALPHVLPSVHHLVSQPCISTCSPMCAYLNRRLTSDLLQIYLNLSVHSICIYRQSAIMLHIPVMMLTRHKQGIYCLFLVFIMTGMCSMTVVMTIVITTIVIYIETEEELCKIADRSLVSGCRSGV